MHDPPHPADLSGTEDFDAIQESFSRHCDSYQRMPELLSLWLRVPRKDRGKWFRLLGEQWQSCDNIGLFKNELGHIFRHAKQAQLHCMMDPQELAAWHDLPEQVAIFRGCDKGNTLGFSFSLRREIAEGFPFLNRYKAKHPVLVTATVPRDTAVLKLGRNEFEIITFCPEQIRVQSVEPLLPPQAR